MLTSQQMPMMMANWQGLKAGKIAQIQGFRYLQTGPEKCVISRMLPFKVPTAMLTELAVSLNWLPFIV